MDNAVVRSPSAQVAAHTAAPDSGRVRGAAQVVTDVLQPRNTILAGLSGFGALVTHSWAGAGWGLFAALCAGIVPAGYIEWERRRGTWGDRHVVDRRQRPRIFAVILASIGIGAAVMLGAGAPSRLVFAMFALWGMTVVLLVVNAAWKISVDCAVVSGIVALLAVAGGPWWSTGCLAVGVVCWSRVALRHHTLAQAVAGALLGAATGASLAFG
ncbi:hypothetical protein OG948_44575 (plasmid) [Embleya sp. NBC_00888]|uniref:hypothetical protein n=1 Tax=Embleya sp. NBC_00888 TaxID=2975960 RepID=UPI002F90FAD6|nr:hypothetical protein OG948_44575 [Embleya sp. NBC_00888]